MLGCGTGRGAPVAAPTSAMDPTGDQTKTLGLPDLADDYRPLPRTRWTQPWSVNAVTIATVAGALAVGFLLTSGLLAGRSAAEIQDARKEQLIAVIEERQERVDAMTAHLDTLRAEVARLEEEAGTPTLQRELERVEQVAGLTGVRGAGLRVVFDDGSDPCPSGQPEDCQIQDVDLQLAVNALFDAGAETVAVNGERVIGTTAIRSAGRAVLVNYRVLSPPYEVVAVGDPDTLERVFSTSDFALDFEIWRDTYGLAFEVEAFEQAELPAYTGSVRLRHAAPVDGDEGQG